MVISIVFYFEKTIALRGYLGFNVLCAQTLSDDVDALTVTQDMGPALRVVHQRFDAADQRGVKLRLCADVVH